MFSFAKRVKLHSIISIDYNI